MTAVSTPPQAPTRAAATRSGPISRLLWLGVHQVVMEVRQFLRSRAAVVFTIGFPVIMLVIFGSIFDDHLGNGVDYTQYFVTGMVASGLMVTGFQALGIQIPIERDRGVLKRLRATPMPRSVYFVGKVGMVFVVAVAEIALLLLIAVPLFDVSMPAAASDWLTLAWVVVLGTAACTLAGIAYSSVPTSSRSATATVTPVALVLQFISGVFFVFTELPPWMQQIAALFPLKWMCQGMRSVFLPEQFGTQEPAGGYELGTVALVLGAWCVGGLLLCLATFRWTTRRDG